MYMGLEVVGGLLSGSLSLLADASHMFSDAGALALTLFAMKVARRGGRQGNLNVRGAWLHVLTDALGSIQAIVAGALIWGLGWNWADPIASVLIGVLVIYSSWSLIALCLVASQLLRYLLLAELLTGGALEWRTTAARHDWFLVP